MVRRRELIVDILQTTSKTIIQGNMNLVVAADRTCNRIHMGQDSSSEMIKRKAGIDRPTSGFLIPVIGKVFQNGGLGHDHT